MSARSHALALFCLWMAFAFALFQSVTISVAWWQGELRAVGAWEMFWIGLLPVLVLLYLRHFSIFACARRETGSRHEDPPAPH